MKKNQIIWLLIGTVLTMCLLSACATATDLGGAAGVSGESTPTATEETVVPSTTEAPVDAPLPTATSIPPSGGRIVFLSSRDGKNNVYAMDPLGGSLVRLIAMSVDEQPRFSPDGSRMAFVSTVGNNTDIYLANADGGNIVRLTNDPAKDASPSWSPDGSRIVFESYRNGNFDLFVMNADGSNVTPLVTDEAGESNPQWSPSGERIAFVSNRGSGNSDIFLVNADGSGRTSLTNDTPPTSDPAWSPDGSRLAYRSASAEDSTTHQICVIAADGSGAQCLTGFMMVGVPVWSSGGTQLAFLATDAAGHTNVEILDLADGSSRVIPLGVDARSDPSWSPEGARVVFQANVEGNMEIFVLTIGNGDLLKLNPFDGFDGSPVWAR